MNLPLQGFGSELSSLSILLNVVLLTFLLRLFKHMGLKPSALFKKPTNPNAATGRLNGIPGTAKPCIEHSKALEKLTERLDNHIELDEKRTDELKKEMKRGFERIYDKLDGKQDKP